MSPDDPALGRSCVASEALRNCLHLKLGVHVGVRVPRADSACRLQPAWNNAVEMLCRLPMCLRYSSPTALSSCLELVQRLEDPRKAGWEIKHVHAAIKSRSSEVLMQPAATCVVMLNPRSMVKLAVCARRHTQCMLCQLSVRRSCKFAMARLQGSCAHYVNLSRLSPRLAEWHAEDAHRKPRAVSKRLLVSLPVIILPAALLSPSPPQVLLTVTHARGLTVWHDKQS